MKYYEIVLFILCLHVGVAIVNGTGIFHSTMQHDEEWFNRLMISTGEDYEQSQVQTDSANWGIGDFVKGLAIFIWNFAVGIIIIPATLGSFGLSGVYIYPLSALIYSVYIAAIAQMVADRQMKGMS